MENSFFDEEAHAFAQSIDADLARCAYIRGRLFADAVKRELAPGSRILDYGCGPGRIARIIAEQGYQVDGVDPSPMMIAEANKQKFDTTKVTFCVAEGNGDFIRNSAYSGIVCSSVIEYVPDAERLLRNFARVLRKDGVLVLSYANKNSLWRAYARYRYSTLRHYGAQCHIWTLSEMQAMLESAGFTVTGDPDFFEAPPFDKRRHLRWLSSHYLVGQLGFVVARRNATGK